MQLIRIEPKDAADKLAEVLIAALENHRSVTWLLPGGSNIPISVAAMAKIPEDLTEKLIISQTDERYGALDHADSNWRQIREAGMDFKRAELVPVLTTEQLELGETASRFGQAIGKLLQLTYVIGQFGIGPDGHIAGIKPGSPAAVAEGLAAGYQAEDFERVTISFSAIRQINEAYAFVFGEPKRATLEKLNNESHQPLNQPAQILKSLSKSTVYNDQIGNAE